MVLDVVSCLPFVYIEYAQGSDESNNRTRLFRLLRLLKLLRILRLGRIFERWEDSIELLHERLESPFPILPQEIIARRKTDPHKKQRFEALLKRAGPDRADRALYEAAMVRFEGELELLRLEGASGRGGGEAGAVVE